MGDPSSLSSGVVAGGGEEQNRLGTNFQAVTKGPTINISDWFAGKNEFRRDDLAAAASAARHFRDDENVILRQAPGIFADPVACHAGFVAQPCDFTHRVHEGEILRRSVDDDLCR